MVNIRNGLMNMSLRDHQVSLVAISSDTFTLIMDVLSLGISVRRDGPYPQLSTTLSGATWVKGRVSGASLASVHY